LLIGFRRNLQISVIVKTGYECSGHHFRLLDRLDDGWKPFWVDTIVAATRETVRIAFIADNPGKWAIDCGPLGRRQDGTAGWFEVT